MHPMRNWVLCFVIGFIANPIIDCQLWLKVNRGPADGSTPLFVWLLSKLL